MAQVAQVAQSNMRICKCVLNKNLVLLCYAISFVIGFMKYLLLENILKNMVKIIYAKSDLFI